MEEDIKYFNDEWNKSLNNIKFVVYYRQDGQTFTIQRESPSVHLYDSITQEEYDKFPKYKYYLETDKGLIECDKYKKTKNDNRRTK